LKWDDDDREELEDKVARKGPSIARLYFAARLARIMPFNAFHPWAVKKV
jgi:hypothetical protein